MFDDAAVLIEVDTVNGFFKVMGPHLAATWHVCEALRACLTNTKDQHEAVTVNELRAEYAILEAG